MAVDERIQGYANAILAFGEAEGNLDAIVEELFSFSRAVESSPRLREALTDPALPAENKAAVLQDLLGERANPHTVSILRFVVELGRGRDLGRIVDEVTRLAAERRQHVVAEVRAAVALDDAHRESLARALSAATGRTVEVKAVLDAGVIGGIVARIGDEVFDGSVRTRLEEAKDLLRSG
jgi:F-type H+-transporting ATPase subunit delta